MLAGMAVPTMAAVPATVAAKILVVGDSISAAYGIDKSAGWVSLLAGRLAETCPQVEVANASVSGETTAGGLARLPALLEQHHPGVVVIELGANDGLRGLPPKHTEANLRRMIQAVRAIGAQPVLLGMRIPPNFGPDYSLMFDKSFRAVAASEQVPWVKFFLDGVGDSQRLMQADGLHPTAEAQPRLLDNAWSVLAPVVDTACGSAASMK